MTKNLHLWVRWLGIFLATLGVSAAHAVGYTPSITTSYPQLAISASAPQVVWASCNSGGQPSAYSACDDGVTTIMPIGFSFTFAGVIYTKWSMSSNGVIFFETAAVGGHQYCHRVRHFDLHPGRIAHQCVRHTGAACAHALLG